MSDHTDCKQLSGKSVLIVGISSGTKRESVWKAFRDAGLHIILIHHDEKSYARSQADDFINYNFEEGQASKDLKHAEAIIELLGDRKSKLSACITFEEDCCHLTAILCQKLGLVGISPEVALIAQGKQTTYEALQSEPDLHNASKYAPLSFRISTKEEIMNIKGLSFPAILKPEFSFFSCGINRVTSLKDAADKFDALNDTFGKHCPGHRYGSSMVLMEYLQGISYQVDVIIFDGVLVKALTCDMGPKLPGNFEDTTTCIPSCLPEDKQTELIRAAFLCCLKVGLNNGVFNVEFKLTPSGFKLIEINPRPGTPRRCVIYRATDNVDVYIAHVLIGCGIKPVFKNVPQVYGVGCYLYSPDHDRQLSDSNVMKKINALVEAKSILYIPGFDIQNGWKPDQNANIAKIVALEKGNVKLAKRKLIKIFKELGLSTKMFNIEELTNCFN